MQQRQPVACIAHKRKCGFARMCGAVEDRDAAAAAGIITHIQLQSPSEITVNFLSAHVDSCAGEWRHVVYFTFRSFFALHTQSWSPQHGVLCVFYIIFLNGELSSVAPFIMRPRRHQIYAKFIPAVVALGIFWSGAPIVIKFMQRERVAATRNKKLVDGSQTFSVLALIFVTPPKCTRRKKNLIFPEYACESVYIASPCHYDV